MIINGIQGINGTGAHVKQMGTNQAADSYSKSIQNQIAYAQKRLQEISSNEDMSLEEKMKKRQEIQQQINDLNRQLRQHQMEQRREQQQTKSSSMGNMPGGAKAVKTGKESAGMSQAGMTAMISAGSALKQATIQGNAAKKLEGRAGVLESEIKLDKSRGGDTRAKKEELAELEQAAMKTTSSQMSTLNDANKTMEEAAKEDDKDISTKEKETEEESSDSKNVQTAETTVTPQPTQYRSVDIRL